MTSFGPEEEYVSRMVNIQNKGNAYRKALAEMKAGQLSHVWPCFVFPLISVPNKRIPRGTARDCAVPAKDCIRFAQALLAHEVAGQRLREAYLLFKPREGVASCEIRGQQAAEKFLSFITLFEHASQGFPEHNADLRELKTALFGDEKCPHTEKAILEYVYTDSSGASRSCSEDGDGARELSRKQCRFLNLLDQTQRKTGICAGTIGEGSNTGPFTELPTNPAWYACMFPVVGMDPNRLEDPWMTASAIPPSDCINIGAAFLRDPVTGVAFLNVCKNLAAFVQKISWNELENTKAWIAQRRRLLSSLTFFESVSYGYEHWRYVCDLLIYLFEDERCPATKALFDCLEFGSETTDNGLRGVVAEICDAANGSGVAE